jgi:hypothetical protein
MRHVVQIEPIVVLKTPFVTQRPTHAGPNIKYHIFFIISLNLPNILIKNIIFKTTHQLLNITLAAAAVEIGLVKATFNDCGEGHLDCGTVCCQGGQTCCPTGDSMGCCPLDNVRIFFKKITYFLHSWLLI